MAKTKHFGPLAAAAGALVAVALLVLMLVMVNPQSAKAAFPGQNGRIAFATNRNGLPNDPENYDIYTISSTGTGLFQRTSGPARDVEPAYSPNGNRIAFQRRPTPNDTYDIWTVNTTGTPNLTRITNNPADDRDPNWSPDGSRIVFSSNRGGGNEQIWEVGSTGTTPEVNPNQVTSAPRDHRRPAYRPDGLRIVFQMCLMLAPCTSSDNWDIVTARPNDPFSYRRTTNNSAADEEPAFSPDGSRIAFSSKRNATPNNPGDTDIFSTLSFDGEAGLVEITRGQAFSTADDEKPAFSPDGRNIVYDSNRSGLPNDPDNYDIFVVHSSFQTQTITQITNDAATDYAADWQSLP
jgi:Tol biopolymer transport system component